MKRWTYVALMLVVAVVVGSWLHGQPAQPPAVPRELTSYREVVKGILPAVVSIETRAKPKAGATPPPLIPEEFRRPPTDADPNRLGFGSGFFVDPAGVIVTNFHVVEGAEVAVVTLHDGRKFTSKNIRSDRRTDVALILLDAKDVRFPTLAFGDSDAMEIGDRVLAVGAPFGLAGSVTHGIISAKGRNGLHLNMYEDFLQTDAAINPGNSGGPLVNLEGKVVGINAAIKSKSGGFQGVGLAVASNLARHVVPDLQKHGAVKRGYLGAQIHELAPELAGRLGVPKDAGAVVIADVYENTPAAKAGLQAGDILTSIAGKSVKDGNALQRIVATLPIGKATDAAVVRAGKTLQVNLTIDEQPADYGVAGSVPAPRPVVYPNGVALDKLGVEVADLTAALADDLGYRKGTQGIVITGVTDESVAALANLRQGTVLARIDNARVTGVTAAHDALKNADLGRGIVLQVITPQGGVNYVLARSPR